MMASAGITSGSVRHVDSVLIAPTRLPNGRPLVGDIAVDAPCLPGRVGRRSPVVESLP
jgi:hypothetical protein